MGQQPTSPIDPPDTAARGDLPTLISAQARAILKRANRSIWRRMMVLFKRPTLTIARDHSSFRVTGKDQSLIS
jgi:hypothetical protein